MRQAGILGLGLTVAVAAVIGGVLLSRALSSEAVQAPRISLDMDPSGNTYDPATNTMTVGAIDACLTGHTNTAVTHTHQTHLIIQNVEDLVAFQVRLNFVGDQMRPTSFNAVPFYDTLRAQAVGFTNLPIDPSTDLHRTVPTPPLVPSEPAGPGPQTSLLGAAYLGSQNAAVSPDTPAKDPPDNASYSAPNGGVLGSLILQVVGDESGQPSLFMNLWMTTTPIPPGRARSCSQGAVQPISTSIQVRWEMAFTVKG